MGHIAKLFNGIGCLAASIVSHFKKEIGGFYLYPPGQRDVDEEYIYTVYSPNHKDIFVKVEKTYCGGSVLYDGPVDEFPIDCEDAPDEE